MTIERAASADERSLSTLIAHILREWAGWLKS
jgi:hypothetical protein